VSAKRYYKRVRCLRTTICRGDRPTALVTVALLIASAAASLRAQSPRVTDDAANRIVALDPRWTVTFATAPAAPAGFDQELAYVPLKGGELQAIDLNYGLVKWKAALTTALTPATGDGLVFTAGEGVVTALEQRSGATIWTTPLEGMLASPLYWDSGLLIASLESGDLVALRAEDGQVMWRQALGAPLATTPTPAGDHLYAALRDGRLMSLALATGVMAWTNPLDEPVTGILALNDQLIVGTRGNRVYSLSLDRGRIRWAQKAGADIAGAPVADERLIYFAALDNLLRAIDRKSGNLRWIHKLPSRPAAGPLRAGNVVLLPLVTTDIGAFVAATGADSFIIRALGETGGVPFIREGARPTATLLISMSREGALQGFAPRIEPLPAALSVLPGTKIGG
jgi:outer membrane protein assembly factor BamB